MTPGTTGRFDQLRAVLVDRSLCPACGAPLTGPRCVRCGVPLDGAAARAVLRLSMEAAQALGRRELALADLYAERDGRSAAFAAAAAGPTTGPRAVRRGPHRPTPASVRATAPGAPAVRRPVPVRGPERAPVTSRWRVQSVLQALGAGLLSAAGIVFLVFSWGVLDLGGRTLVVAGGTVVVFLLAGRLARRGLAQGAEAVGAVAAVLLALDAWALRRTGVVRLGEPGTYAGVACLLCAVLLAWWGRSARLRVGSVAGAVLWLAAPVPLAAVHPSPLAFGWGLLATAVLASVRHVPLAHHVLGGPGTGATGIAVLSGGALVGSCVAGVIGVALLPTNPAGAVVLSVATAAVGAVQWLLTRLAPVGPDPRTAGLWHGLSVGTALIGVVAALGLDGLGSWTGLTLVLSACAFGLVALGGREVRPPAPPGTAPWRSASLHDLVDRPSVTLAPTAMLLSVAGVGQLGAPPGVDVALLLLVAAAAAMAGARRPGNGRAAGALTTAARVTVLGGAGAALLAGHRSSLATALTLGAWAAVAVLVRTWAPSGAWAARSTSAATPFGVAAIGVLAHRAGAGAGDALQIAAAAGAALLALLVAAPDRPRKERQVALAAAASAAVSAWLAGAVVPGWLGRTTLLVAVAVCLLVVLGLAAGERLVGPLPAVVAAGAAAPVLALAAATAAADHGAVPAVTPVVLISACGGAGAVLLGVVAQERRGPSAGVAARAGGSVTLCGAAVAGAFESAWLVATVLLLASAAALVTGIRERKATMRWAALVLATAASWTLLGTGGAGCPELFVVPTAAVVATVGALRVRARRDDGLALLGAGLALTVLPTALLDGTLPLPGGLHVERSVVTTTVAVVLAATAAVAGRRGRPGLTAVLAALGAGVALLGPSRLAVGRALDGRADAFPDLVGVLAAVLILLCATSVRRSAPPPSSQRVAAVEPWLVVGVGVLPVLLAAHPGPAGWWRFGALAAPGLVTTLAGARGPLHGRDPWRVHAMGVGLLVSTAAAVVAVRVVPAAPEGLVPTVLGALVMTTVLLRPPVWNIPADRVRTVGALVLLCSVLAGRTGVWRPLVWLSLAAALLLAAWSIHARPGTTLAVRAAGIGTAVLVVLGPWWSAVVRALHLAGTAGGMPERWSLPSAVVLMCALLLAWPRSDGIPSRLTLVSPALPFAALPSLLAEDGSALGAVRAVTAFALGSVLAAVAQHRRLAERSPVAAKDAALADSVGLGTAALTALTASVAGAWAADLPFLALGLVLTALGARRTIVDRDVSSWPAVGPGLACALVVPALVSIGDPAPWRPVVVVVLAVAATVAGAVLRWQAPFVVGAATLVVVTLVQLGPWAGQVLVRTQGWVLLAVCGTLLLALGLRYERRITQARDVVQFVATMR